MENQTDQTIQKKKPVRKSNKWPGLGNAPLNEIISYLKLPTDYDLVIVGDGSGYPDSESAAGYACIWIDRLNNRDMVAGSGRYSVYHAELSALLYGLLHYHETCASRTRAALGKKVLNTIILSDNQAVVEVGSKGCIPGSSQWNAAPLWYGFMGLIQMGYACKWQHIPRDLFSLHKLADHASRTSRLKLDELVPDFPDISLEIINPIS